MKRPHAADICKKTQMWNFFDRNLQRFQKASIFINFRAKSDNKKEIFITFAYIKLIFNFRKCNHNYIFLLLLT